MLKNINIFCQECLKNSIFNSHRQPSPSWSNFLLLKKFTSFIHIPKNHVWMISGFIKNTVSEEYLVTWCFFFFNLISCRVLIWTCHWQSGLHHLIWWLFFIQKPETCRTPAQAPVPCFFGYPGFGHGSSLENFSTPTPALEYFWTPSQAPASVKICHPARSYAVHVRHTQSCLKNILF